MSAPTDGSVIPSVGGQVRPLTVADIEPLINEAVKQIINVVSLNVREDNRRTIETANHYIQINELLVKLDEFIQITSVLNDNVVELLNRNR